MFWRTKDQSSEDKQQVKASAFFVEGTYSETAALQEDMHARMTRSIYHGST